MKYQQPMFVIKARFEPEEKPAYCKFVTRFAESPHEECKYSDQPGGALVLPRSVAHTVAKRLQARGLKAMAMPVPNWA